MSFRKLQIVISQTTDCHFANCRFSFRKLHIFISQTTDSHFANYRFSFCIIPFRFVSLHFVSQTTVSRFYKRFPPISNLIDLARWVKINTYFIPRLRLIMLSGTESNRGTKCLPRLARFNPQLALIGFPGTRAWTFIFQKGSIKVTITGE